MFLTSHDLSSTPLRLSPIRAARRTLGSLIFQYRLSFASAFWIRALCASLSFFWLVKLIETEREVDEEQFNHQVEAACEECMLKIEFVSGLV